MSRVTPSTYHSRIARLASLRSVHAAFQWFHLEERRIMEWQRAMVEIPAPPFGESARAQRLADFFRQAGLERVAIDAEGNVTGMLAGCSDELPMTGPEACNRPCILLSAHIDTAFPPGTPAEATLTDHRLQAPGACDNGAGIAAILAIASGIKAAGALPELPILFVGNVGEEGEGDLRGMRFLYRPPEWKGRVAAHIVLDGAGTGSVVTEALGSRRYLAALDAPGGHSWADAGSPNTIVWMAEAVLAFEHAARKCAPEAASPTTWNVGTIQGGSSVNAIPERTEARFDLRSLDADQLVRLEVALHRAIEDAALGAERELSAHWKTGKGTLLKTPGTKAQTATHASIRPKPAVRFEIKKIGDRPPGRLPPDAPLIQTLRAADRHLGIRTQELAASTDANIPLALGVPAISMGAGGSGGGIHTRREWYDATGRDLALRRILLLLLGIGERADPTAVPKNPR